MKVQLALAVLLTAAASTAQVDIVPHDGGIEYASRYSTGDEWACQRFSVDSYGGGVAEIKNMTAIIQDLDCATQETLQFVVFDERSTIPGVPALNTRLFDSGPFLAPVGTGGCARRWTLTPPTPVAHPGRDVFAGSFLQANSGLAGGTDGNFSQISVEVAGGCPTTGTCSLEFPNGLAVAQYPPTTSGSGPGAEYGLTMLSAGAIRYATNWSTWAQTLAPGNDHVARAGASDPTNAVFSAVPAVSPDNYGMAGRFPDATNQTGTAPARRDNPVWTTEHGTLQSGIAVLLLTGRTLRDGGLAAIPFAGIGLLELDPTDGLFAPSAGGLPGLSGPISGATATYSLSLDATGVRTWMRGGIKVTVQELRIDLATGAVSLSSLATSTWL